MRQWPPTDIKMPDRYRPITSSLRSRLLALTVFFITVVELLVFMPWIAAYRQGFLEERLIAAQVAALSLEEAPGHMVSPRLEQQLLETAGVIAVIVRREDKSLMLGFDLMPAEADAVIDLRQASLGMLIADAFDTFQAKGGRIIRVVGEPSLPGTRWVEITMSEMGLYEAMVAYSSNVLILSVIVSVMVGLGVYLALHWLMVRPMRRLKNTIVSFRLHPEAKGPHRRLVRRRDEIGVVSRELVRMQDELQANLKEKTRLAELGEAVSKINHDLRNILTTAQLATDRLSKVDDPRIVPVARRLMTSVSRAVALCERTLRHGRADEPAPVKGETPLLPLLEDVAATLGLDDDGDFKVYFNFPKDFWIWGDGNQLHRVFLNLARNAHEAQGQAGSITFTAERDDTGTFHIDITDTGPGIPAHLVPNLFKPFLAVAKAGGSGLGLAIARDIVLAHGGQIGLKETGEGGTTFRVCLPGPDPDGED